MQLVAARDDEVGLFIEDYVDAVGHHTLVRSEGLAAARGAEIEAAACVACARAASQRLAEWPTTAGQDEELLRELGEPANLACYAAPNDIDDGNYRRIAAVRYRLAAKRLLCLFVEKCEAVAQSRAMILRE